MFSSKNGLLNVVVPQYFAQSPFRKINFSPICYVINEMTVSREHNVIFQNFCTKTELKEQVFGNHPNQFCTSDPTGQIVK